MQTTLDWLTTKVPQTGSFTTATKLAAQNENPPGNLVPIADAGDGSTVVEGRPAEISASGSLDLDGTIVSYSWTQVSGTTVAIADPSAAQTGFDAPSWSSSRATVALFNPQASAFGETLAFDVTVTDEAGGTATDRVEVIVLDEDFEFANGSILAPLTVLFLVWAVGLRLLARRRQRIS